MLIPGFHCIDTCRVDAAMAEQVCKADNISVDRIKDARKQMPQGVGIDFLGGYPSSFA